MRIKVDNSLEKYKAKTSIADTGEKYLKNSSVFKSAKVGDLYKVAKDFAKEFDADITKTRLRISFGTVEFFFHDRSSIKIFEDWA